MICSQRCTIPSTKFHTACNLCNAHLAKFTCKVQWARVVVHLDSKLWSISRVGEFLVTVLRLVSDV